MNYDASGLDIEGFRTMHKEVHPGLHAINIHVRGTAGLALNVVGGFVCTRNNPEG